jgi:undecaprenyl-diphosphatase
MQALTVGGATRTDLKSQRRLLAEIHEQVVRATDLEEVQLAQVQRIRPRTVVMAVVLFAVVWVLIPQFADLPRTLQQVRDANWAWMVPALALSMLTYVGAAMALSASVSRRLPVSRTTLVTLAGSFVNRVSPAKVGGIALNLRYLQKQGVETPVAAASIGLYQGVGLLVHLSLLLVFGLWAGRTVSASHLLPSGTLVFVVVAVVLTVAGVAVAVPRIRRLFRTFVRPQLSKIAANLRGLLQSPGRLSVMVLGSAVLTMSYIGALWASIQAFGGGLPVAGVAIVFLAGASVAAAAPTPGGIGAVEAALAAGLTALGLASDVAVPAVFLYRLATFWVPVLPGWLGFTILQRRGDI